MAKAVDYTKVQWQTFTDAVQNRNSYMAAAGNPKIMPKMNMCFRNQTVCVFEIRPCVFGIRQCVF